MLDSCAREPVRRDDDARRPDAAPEHRHVAQVDRARPHRRRADPQRPAGVRAVDERAGVRPGQELPVGAADLRKPELGRPSWTRRPRDGGTGGGEREDQAPQRRNPTVSFPRSYHPRIPPCSTGRASMPAATRTLAATAARAPLAQIVTTGRPFPNESAHERSRR